MLTILEVIKILVDLIIYLKHPKAIIKLSLISKILPIFKMAMNSWKTFIF